ncbi:MAG: hypothetical protein RL069_2463 [Planctomycetota bacterium]
MSVSIPTSRVVYRPVDRGCAGKSPTPVNDRATQKPVVSQGNFERQELSVNFAIEIDDVDQGHRPDFHHQDDGPMRTTTVLVHRQVESTAS